MMGMSLDYTAAKIWREALAGANLLGAEIADFTQLNKVNRAVNEVAAQIYPAVVNGYLTRTTPTVSSDAISIASTRIERSQISRLTLSSSAITNANIRIVSPEEFYAFRSSAQHNSSEIIAAVVGSSILLAKGTGLSEYGTITMVYPRTPTQVAAETETVDLPDGIPCQMAILRLQKILADEYKTPPKETRQEMANLIARFYDSVGLNLSTQELEEKSKALS